MEELKTRHGAITVDPSCPQSLLVKYRLDRGLGYFWHNRPDLQYQALVKIAAQPQGQVAVAHNKDGLIVGYLTVTAPEEDTRWGRDHVEGLLEMGGIEVSRNWRGLGIGRALIRAVFAPDAFVDKIVIATGYRWCWDMESTGLSVSQYREMLNGMFGEYGFQLSETDEPNIAWYPDNGLVVRIGPQTPPGLMTKFKSLLFERPGSEYVSGEFMS